MKSDWLPTMPLHVAIWSQIVMDSDLSWADQGKAIRVLANAWSTGELIRAKWCGDEAWRAAERMWPEMLAARNENIAKRDKLSESGKRGNEIRWRSRGDSPPESPPESPPDSPPDSPGDRIQSRSISSKQKQEHNQKKDIGRRGSRLPDDAVLTDEWRKVAADEGVPASEVETLFREFVGYWTALPGQKATKLDWLATWRNRCIAKAPSYRRSPSPQPDPSRRNSFVPEPARQNIPTADETRARIRAEDEERRRQELRAQLRSVS